MKHLYATGNLYKPAPSLATVSGWGIDPSSSRSFSGGVVKNHLLGACQSVAKKGFSLGFTNHKKHPGGDD